MHLDNDPLMSYQDLAEKVGISWPTAKKRYKEAKKREILFNPLASYHFKKMGLVNVTVLAYTPNYNSLDMVEKACEIHPHTIYRSRLIGKEFGIFMKYYIPDNETAFNNLIEFISILKEKGWIEDYNLYNGNSTYEDNINIYSNLDYYDFEDGIWKFEWSDWFQKLMDSKDHPSAYQRIKVEKIETEELSLARLTILNRLTKDASIKQADLMRDPKLNLSRTEAHRQYNYVMENLVFDIENMYDRARFDLSDLNLFVIENMDQDKMAQFCNLLEKDPPPFRVSLEILNENTIIMWANMSQHLAQTFGYEMWQLNPQMKMYSLVYSGTNSRRYAFYVENYDFRKQEWNSSRKWMVEDPIRILEETNK